jgi:transposase-like protein
VNDERTHPKKCPQCGQEHWETRIKRQRYRCVNCGFTRDKKEGNSGWNRKFGKTKQELEILTPKQS